MLIFKIKVFNEDDEFLHSYMSKWDKDSYGNSEKLKEETFTRFPGYNEREYDLEMYYKDISIQNSYDFARVSKAFNFYVEKQQPKTSTEELIVRIVPKTKRHKIIVYSGDNSTPLRTFCKSIRDLEELKESVYSSFPQYSKLPLNFFYRDCIVDKHFKTATEEIYILDQEDFIRLFCVPMPRHVKRNIIVRIVE